ncbi:hypothetical protein MMC13_005006 [Lambiella insularis]|nr:hypothetical protein [Lambiella insularis]
MAPSKQKIPSGRRPGRPPKHGRLSKATTTIYPLLRQSTVTGTDGVGPKGVAMKRGRGRPRKIIIEDTTTLDRSLDEDDILTTSVAVKAKRERGRPKKIENATKDLKSSVKATQPALASLLDEGDGHGKSRLDLHNATPAIPKMGLKLSTIASKEGVACSQIEHMSSEANEEDIIPLIIPRRPRDNEPQHELDTYAPDEEISYNPHTPERREAEDVLNDIFTNKIGGGFTMIPNYVGQLESLGVSLQAFYKKLLVLLKERDIPINYNAKFAHLVSVTTDGVELAFTNGTTKSASLLIGAEDMSSEDDEEDITPPASTKAPQPPKQSVQG